jgi:hypothetical protein
MYVLHLLHLAMTVSETTGTGSSPSPKDLYGVITNPSGIFDLPNKELEFGIVFRVHR